MKPTKIFRINFLTIFSAMCLFLTTQVLAQLPSDVQVKVGEYQQKLATWAQDPEVINAIKEMNSSIPSMTNDAWKGLTMASPEVQKYMSNPVGMKLQSWQEDKSLGKLFLRDKNGNFVAGSKKPAIYNIKDRKPFMNAIQGKQWSAKRAKIDPTTKRSSIQLSQPVVSEGVNIGIIHTAIILE